MYPCLRPCGLCKEDNEDFVLERSPCETPIHDRSGISCFSKRGEGSPTAQHGCFGHLWSRPIYQSGNFQKIDPKCRRVLNQKRWFECTAIIFFQECVTWRSTSNLNCIKKVEQPIFGLIKNSKITDIHRKSFRFKIDCGSTNESKLCDNPINNCVRCLKNLKQKRDIWYTNVPLLFQKSVYILDRF